MSHFDVVTYHMTITELLSVFGLILLSCGVHTELSEITAIGIFLRFLKMIGQTFFHLLTCMERYLAVVHPITYLSLRKAKWVRIRNVTIGCVWLMCFVLTGLIFVKDKGPINIIAFCVTSFAILIVSFCSLSVLCALTHPGPGEGVGGRQQVDQSKLRAFYTTTATLGTMLVTLVGYIISLYIYGLFHLAGPKSCGVLLSGSWFNLPSALLFPLLFLQRVDRLLCCQMLS